MSARHARMTLRQRQVLLATHKSFGSIKIRRLLIRFNNPKYHQTVRPKLSEQAYALQRLSDPDHFDQLSLAPTAAPFNWGYIMSPLHRHSPWPIPCAPPGDTLCPLYPVSVRSRRVLGAVHPIRTHSTRLSECELPPSLSLPNSST